MNDNQACCAHCKVVLKHTDYPDGTRSDYWECSDGCGAKFWPESFSSQLQSKLTATEKELAMSKEREQSFQRELEVDFNRANEAEQLVSELTSALKRLLLVLSGTVCPKPWQDNSPLAEAEQALSHATAVLKERKE